MPGHLLGIFLIVFQVVLTDLLFLILDPLQHHSIGFSSEVDKISSDDIPSPTAGVWVKVSPSSSSSMVKLALIVVGRVGQQDFIGALSLRTSKTPIGGNPLGKGVKLIISRYES